jgi:hypothetical protein
MKNLKHISENLNLQLYILSGSNINPNYRDIYEKTYICWKEVWQYVYESEMKQNHKFFSDDFQRQEEIISLFAGNSCVGMAFVRSADLSLKPVREDSCFRFWPQDSMENILSLSPNIAIASYFTIHQDFRKMKLGLCWKTLLLALFVQNFHESQSDIMVTAARKIKSNEKLCYKLGAKPISSSLPYWIDDEKQVNEETADIVYWDKTPLTIDDLLISSLKERIWENKINAKKVISIKKEVKHAA